jgi:hypothetical protein
LNGGRGFSAFMRRKNPRVVREFRTADAVVDEDERVIGCPVLRDGVLAGMLDPRQRDLVPQFVAPPLIATDRIQLQPRYRIRTNKNDQCLLYAQSQCRGLL